MPPAEAANGGGQSSTEAPSWQTDFRCEQGCAKLLATLEEVKEGASSLERPGS